MGYMKERMGFKVGDRVEVSDDYYEKMLRGITGTVYQIDDDCSLYIDVILDGFTEGHDGHAKDRSTNHRYFNAEELKVLTSTKHNVGDWVQVRSYLSTEKSYGGIYPSEQMLHKVGQKVRIKAVTKTGRYKIEGSCFTWTDEMFEEAKKETKVEPKTEKTHRYNVGDKVRVRKDLDHYTTYFMNDHINGDSFVRDMAKWAGKIVTIATVNEKYTIKEDTWNWTDDMFEDYVEPTKKRELKVGDRIRMKKDYCFAKVGMTGVIKCTRDREFGVEFDDEFAGGHGCCGHTKSNRGHWVNECHFEIIDTPKYSIATVTFDNDKEYCYLCDISVKKGDKVVVPCGSCDRETIATVIKTGKYTEENAPYPIDKMKKVIRKGTDTKPTSENDFDWDKFKKTKIIVHCRTQKSWDNFLEECEKRDIKWNDGECATYHSDTWSRKTDKSSIMFNLNWATGMTQTDVEWHRKEVPNAAVYDWTSKKYVDKPVKEKKVEDKPTYKIGDRVKITRGYRAGNTGVIHNFKDGSIWDVDVIVDNLKDGHSGTSKDNSTNHWYVTFDEIEKIENEEKPIPKIEVGDVVRAIDNYYGLTNLRRAWEGIVTLVTGNAFTALTTHANGEDRASYTKFYALDPEHFEIINKNT